MPTPIESSETKYTLEDCVQISIQSLYEQTLRVKQGPDNTYQRIDLIASILYFARANVTVCTTLITR
jgi:hypothetical protein